MSALRQITGSDNLVLRAEGAQIVYFLEILTGGVQ
jgi:hypothetical protein